MLSYSSPSNLPISELLTIQSNVKSTKLVFLIQAITHFNLVKVGVISTVFLSFRPYKYANAEFFITPIYTVTEPERTITNCKIKTQYL